MGADPWLASLALVDRIGFGGDARVGIGALPSIGLLFTGPVAVCRASPRWFQRRVCLRESVTESSSGS